MNEDISTCGWARLTEKQWALLSAGIFNKWHVQMKHFKIDDQKEQVFSVKQHNGLINDLTNTILEPTCRSAGRGSPSQSKQCGEVGHGPSDGSPQPHCGSRSTVGHNLSVTTTAAKNPQPPHTHKHTHTVSPVSLLLLEKNRWWSKVQKDGGLRKENEGGHLDRERRIERVEKRDRGPCALLDLSLCAGMHFVPMWKSVGLPRMHEMSKTNQS